MIVKVGFTSIFFQVKYIFNLFFNLFYFWGEISDGAFMGFAIKISAIIHQSTRACVFHRGFLKYWKTLDDIFLFLCVSHLEVTRVISSRTERRVWTAEKTSLCRCVTESEHFSHVLSHISEAIYQFALDLT